MVVAITASGYLASPQLVLEDIPGLPLFSFVVDWRRLKAADREFFPGRWVRLTNKGRLGLTDQEALGDFENFVQGEDFPRLDRELHQKPINDYGVMGLLQRWGIELPMVSYGLYARYPR